MSNLRVPIKVVTKKAKVGGIEYNKFRKFAILLNRKMNKYQDTRSLKPQAYIKQEAMENFVFPDEIKTKLMKMRKLKNIFYVP